MTKCSTGLVAAVLVFLLSSAAFGQAAKEKEWDQLAAKVLAGEKLSAETIAACGKEFKDYTDRLRQKSQGRDLRGLSDEDNAAHYVNAVRMSVIDPKQHGGWPFRHDGRARAYGAIRQRLEKEDDAALMAAVIIPAIDNDDVPFAIATLRKLQTTGPAWANYIVATVRQQYSYVPASAVFLDACGAEAPGEPKRADGIGPRRNSECNGKRYLAGMTKTALRASPDLDITKAGLPKPMAEIIEIAFAQFESIAGTRKGWTHSGVHFLQPQGGAWERPDPELAKHWYYMIEFSGKTHDEGARYPRDIFFCVPVTVDGRLGGIWYEGPVKVIIVESK